MESSMNQKSNNKIIVSNVSFHPGIVGQEGAVDIKL